MESKVIRLNEDEITAVTIGLYNYIHFCEKSLKIEEDGLDHDSDKWINYYNFQIKQIKKVIEKL